MIRLLRAAALLIAPPLAAATIVVTTADDSGPGSLRAALEAAQNGDRIEFAIGSGARRIAPASLLPYPSGRCITIDGTTQPGYAGVPLIELDANQIPEFSEGYALKLSCGEIRGLTIHGGRFANLYLLTPRPSSSVVRGCVIGLRPDGTATRRATRGIALYGVGTIRVGGTEAGDGNVISGHSSGIRAEGQLDVSVQGNTFGSNPAETAAVFSGAHIVAAFGVDIRIGGDAPNYFLGNRDTIGVSTIDATRLQVLENFFGVTRAGVRLPVELGIALTSTNDARIQGNTIVGSTLAAIRIFDTSVRNTITANVLSQNAFGIDLLPPYQPTPNDEGDADTGPNNLLNFPVIDRAVIIDDAVRVEGTYSGAPNLTHRIELFASSACNASGYGEGEQHVDTFEVTTDGNGRASFTREVFGQPAGAVITATATTPVDGTSEFSPCTAVTGGSPGTLPRISSVSPSTGDAAGGTHVRVTGARFDPGCWLFFDGVPAASVVVRGTETITGVAPPHAAGAAGLQVRCGSGASSNVSFTYTTTPDPRPQVFGVSPAAGAPGETIVVRGLHFRPGDSVRFNGTPATVIDAEPDRFVVVVPNMPAGRVAVTVMSERGGEHLAPFDVLAPVPPRLDGVVPATAAAGGEIEVNGEGLRSGQTFAVAGREAAVVELSFRRAVIRLAADTPAGTHPVQLRDTSGTVVATGPQIAISSGIVLSAVEPRCANTEGGVLTTLRGSGFAVGAAVTFDGVAATDVTVLDAMTIRARVPAGSAGPAQIAVIQGAQRGTLTDVFRYYSRFDPRRGCGRTRAIRH